MYYPLMTVAQICALPVSQIADDNSHLWIWSTNSALKATHEIIDAWGFRYITVLTWVKPRFGMGPYLRNASEQLLFAFEVGRRSCFAASQHGCSPPYKTIRISQKRFSRWSSGAHRRPGSNSSPGGGARDGMPSATK